MRQLDGIQEAAEIGRASRCGAYFWAHGGRGNGQAAALTAPGHAKAGRVDLGTR